MNTEQKAGRRFFADVFDGDGEFYVFDQHYCGDEVAGPFKTLGEAKAEAIARNQRVEDNTERPWAFNSERLQITLGICGDAQEGSFMNATLQSTQNDPNLEFSVAIHVEVPAEITTQDALAEYLGGKIFGQIVHDNPELHVEIQLGPEERGDEWG